MDEAAKWVLMAAPALITALAAIAGFRAWHWQLVAKRQFEVAEQAMTVAERTTDALGRIRRIFITREELVAIEVSDQCASGEVVKALRRARAIRKRIDEEEAIPSHGAQVGRPLQQRRPGRPAGSQHPERSSFSAFFL
jgi:hypothetical protein